VIIQISVHGFKSLEKVDLTLGHLNLFIGTNASGKSNFFDALRVLQGIGYGFSIDEIFNGKPKSANSDVWEPIRGGSAKAGFINKAKGETEGSSRVLFSVLLEVRVGTRAHIVHYLITISPKTGWVLQEVLSIDSTEIYNSLDVDSPPWKRPILKVRYNASGRGRKPHLDFQRSKPVLNQLLRDSSCTIAHRKVIESVTRALSNTQRVDPSPAILREYSQAQAVQRIGERGENFAALINAIQSDETTRSAYVSWLKQLTPTELDDVTVLKGALQEPLFAIKEGGVEYPAPILSDGTLRFAAITAAFFQPDMPDILTIEEIENGIHPSRLRLLVELLRSQASQDRQVMATTHSPVVLAWLKPSDYSTTFFCTRDEETGASRIVPLNEVPKFESIVQKQSIGELFAEGWLEEAL
jgi:predicted ATPase